MASLALTGCFEEENRTYDGPTLAEFRPANTATSGTFYVRNLTNPTVAAGPRRDSVAIQVVVPKPHTAPLVVNYEIDATSTAQATRDYVLVSPAGSVTFQPGIYTQWVYFNTVPDADATTTTPRTLLFNLMDTGDVKASVNYKRFTFNIAR